MPANHSYQKGEILLDNKGQEYLIDLVHSDQRTAWVKVPRLHSDEEESKWKIDEFEIPFEILDMMDIFKP